MIFDPRPEAAAFWRRVGEAEPFPRQLRRAATRTLSLAVIHLPRLSVREAQDWLSRHGVEDAFPAADRDLRGCLVANGGHGFIFLDGAMDPDEERVTLAHEVAHFLRHYERPRLMAVRKLGPEVTAALDGNRPLAASERVAGILRDVPLGPYRHALGRDEVGRPDEYTLTLEAEADLLGYELLAPSRRIASSSAPGQDCRELLELAYGFPPESALAWARWIDARRTTDRFLDRLQLAAKKIELPVETSGLCRKNASKRP